MRLFVTLLAGALVLTGCSSGETDEKADGTQGTPSESPRSLSSSPSQSLEAPQSPGESGAESAWAVVGVARDDKLVIRRQPREKAQVVGRLQPDARDVKAGKRTKGTWRALAVDGRDGWASARNLAMLGKPVDVTSEAREVGIAPTRFRLVRKVASRQAGVGDGPLIGPVLVSRDKQTFTLDVLGYADDAVRGERFVVRVGKGEAGFEVRSATAIPMCARGVDAAGLCN